MHQNLITHWTGPNMHVGKFISQPDGLTPMSVMYQTQATPMSKTSHGEVNKPIL